jgi:hypothetical protein
MVETKPSCNFLDFLHKIPKTFFVLLIYSSLLDEPANRNDWLDVLLRKLNFCQEEFVQFF